MSFDRNKMDQIEEEISEKKQLQNNGIKQKESILNRFAKEEPKKVRKGKKTKYSASFSIDADIYDAFSKYCEENSANKSKLVEKLIKEFLEKK